MEVQAAIINIVCTQGQLFIYGALRIDIMWPSSAPLIPLRRGQEIAPIYAIVLKFKLL